MKKLTNYLLPIQTKDLYAKESVSSISLAHDVADKINEIVTYLNTHEDLTAEKILEQDGKIRKGIIYMKDNLANTINDLLELMKSNGELDSIINDSLREEMGRLNELVTNVKNFGGMGNGLVDDTNAIKNALKVANCVYLPEGVYRISNPIELKSNMIIYGKNAKIITDNPIIFKGVNLENVKILNLTLESLVDTSNTINMKENVNDERGYNLLNAIITINNSKDVKVESCKVIGGFTGILVSESENVLVKGNEVTLSSHIGVCLSRSDFRCLENYIHDLKDYDVAHPKYLIQATDNENKAYQDYSVIDNNILKNNPCWDAIMSHRYTKLKITNNIMENVRNGVDLTGVSADYVFKDVLIADNLISGTSENKWSTPSLNHGISLLHTAGTIKDVVVSNNIIKNFGLFECPSGGSLIHIQNVDGVSIVNNHLEFNGKNNGDFQSNIMLKGSVKNLRIGNNIMVSNDNTIMSNKANAFNINITNNIASGTHNIFMIILGGSILDKLMLKDNSIGSITNLDYIYKTSIINGYTYNEDVSNTFNMLSTGKIMYMLSATSLSSKGVIHTTIQTPTIRSDVNVLVNDNAGVIPDGVIIRAKYSDSTHIKVSLYNLTDESISIPQTKLIIKLD